jgi:hypothetical protein
VLGGKKPSAGHAVCAPSHFSAASHTPPLATRQTTPAFPAGCWQVALEPSQVSVVHGSPSSGHVVPAVAFTSAGHASCVPSHVSATSQTPAAGRQTNVLGCFASGHVVLAPSHTSATSHGEPFAARHVVPALPAGCWHRLLAPLHWSLVQTLPSSEQVVPDFTLASVGHASSAPSQKSVASHSPAAGRHTVLVGAFASAHVVLVPSQKSATSHGEPFATRHAVPALPAGCWHAALAPSHWSVVHTLPSSGQLVPAVVFASVVQALFVPSHLSATSHGPADGRQTNVFGSFTSLVQALLVPSQLSATSHGPADGRQTNDAGCFASAVQPLEVPSQWSSLSHGPAEARHTVDAGSLASAGHAVAVPSQRSAASHTPAAARHT